MSITNIIFTFMGAFIASIVWAMVYILLLTERNK